MLKTTLENFSNNSKSYSSIKMSNLNEQDQDQAKSRHQFPTARETLNEQENKKVSKDQKD